MSPQQVINHIAKCNADLIFALEIQDNKRFVQIVDQLTHFMRIVHDRIPRQPSIADPLKWDDDDDDDLVSPL